MVDAPGRNATSPIGNQLFGNGEIIPETILRVAMNMPVRFTPGMCL